MSGYNRVIMLGNLTRDPDFKSLPSGQNLCKLGLACNRQFKSRQGEVAKDDVCFVDIEVWGAQAESCNKFLKKGHQILIEGRLKLDSWQDQEGQKRSKHSIVADRVTFVRGKSEDEASAAAEEEPRATSAAAPRAAKSAKKEIKEETFDDELPF